MIGAVHARAPIGSFDPSEITYLLDDIGERMVETSTEERERAIQGGRHYASLLPLERQPSPRYLSVVDRAIERRIEPVAALVSRVGHQLVAGDRPIVLVSIARAGCPIGILLRRYLRDVEGITVAHLAASVIKGHGLDPAAARWIATAHPDAEPVYVDGWTGKGAIADEIATLGGRFVALVDPAGRTDLCGTRSDDLVPTACLNALSHGMVSRTVLNPDRPNGFDGAKAYAPSPLDRSNAILDAVTRHLRRPAEPATHTATGPASDPASDRCTARGVVGGTASRHDSEAAIDAAGRHWTGGDTRRIRPGVGEAIRVLLRRVPERLVVRDRSDPHVEPLLVLADELGVPVSVEDTLYWRALAVVARVR